MDYTVESYKVTFPANNTRAPLRVAIMEDVMLEHSEMFNLTINASSLPNYVDVSNPFQIPVTILDDDGNHLILLYHVCVCIYNYTVANKCS